MSRTTKVKISITLKFITFICVLSAFLMYPEGIPSLLMFFTGQSNFLIGILQLVLGILLIRSFKSGKYELDTIPYILQLICTVAITVTGIIFCGVLAPVFLASGAPLSVILSPYQMLLHVVVPLLSIVDFLCFTRPLNFTYKFRDFVWPISYPLFYLAFQVICYVRGIEFYPGVTYPYFFMNWGSPAGVWGFSKEMPYFMGGGYWIIIILLLVLGISFLYLRIVNKHIVKCRDNLI